MNNVWYTLLLALGLAGSCGALVFFLSRRQRQTGTKERRREIVFRGAVKSMREGLYPGLEKLLIEIPGLPLLDVPSKTSHLQELSSGSVGQSEDAVTQFQESSAGVSEDEAEPILKFEGEPERAVAKVQKFPPEHIFREYDIRGLVEGELDPEHVKWIGRAIGSEIRRAGRNQALIGRDGRDSSETLTKALAKGMLSTGVNLFNLGAVPTPVLYFAQHQQGVLDGVMVTASHNSVEYNGFKVVVGGQPLWGDQVRDLYRRIRDQDLKAGIGALKNSNVFPKYLKAVSDCFHPAQDSMKIVVDCANGMAGSYIPFLLRKQGHEVIELFCDTGGAMPNEAPDPTVLENLQTLRDRVCAEGAVLGLAFDGDGDRLVVVDARGEIVWPDRLLMLFAEDLLKQQPEAKIVYDVKCSMHLAPYIQKLGGTPIMWKTGHSLIRHKMQESGALLGGELSGHLFFRDGWYGFDDAIYAACRLVDLLSGLDREPVEVLQGLLGAFGSPEYRLSMQEQESKKLIEDMKAHYRGGEANLIEIDGLRVEYADRWGLLRRSNTSSKLIFRFEGEAEDSLQRIQEEFHECIGSLRPGLELPF